MMSHAALQLFLPTAAVVVNSTAGSAMHKAMKQIVCCKIRSSGQIAASSSRASYRTQFVLNFCVCFDYCVIHDTNTNGDISTKSI